jgi:predicted aspartyl protease
MSFKEWKISSTGIEPMELVGEVFDSKAVAIFFDEFGKKYRKRMHVDTKSDVTIIPLSFAELLGLKFEVKAIVNGSEGYLSRVKVRIGEKEFVTTVFCESEGKSYILGVKTLQEFSSIEIDFKNKLSRFHY